MSMPTLTLIATPDPADRAESLTIVNLRDQLDCYRYEYGELLAAARATLAADARTMPNPLGYLRDYLTAINSLPEVGARPTDYQPTNPAAAVWGRW